MEFETIGNVVSAKLIFEDTTPPKQSDIRLYLAYYRGDRLVRLEAPVIIDMTASFIIPDELQDCDITVYVWDKNMKPLMDVQKVRRE